jgi:hypothetical protein
VLPDTRQYRCSSPLDLYVMQLDHELRSNASNLHVIREVIQTASFIRPIACISCLRDAAVLLAIALSLMKEYVKLKRRPTEVSTFCRLADAATMRHCGADSTSYILLLMRCDHERNFINFTGLHVLIRWQINKVCDCKLSIGAEPESNLFHSNVQFYSSHMHYIYIDTHEIGYCTLDWCKSKESYGFKHQQSRLPCEYNKPTVTRGDETSPELRGQWETSYGFSCYSNIYPQ